MRRPSIDSFELLEAQVAADVHCGPSDSEALAELRNEYEAFQASTAALIAELRLEVEEKDRAAAAAMAWLADDTQTQRLSKAADGTPLEWHLQRAEAALERERATGGALSARLQAEQQAVATLRAQLEAAESKSELLRVSEHALQAELARLRQEAAQTSAAEEVSSRSAALATSLEDAERRCAAATTLADKLFADNEALTELVNQQAALLRAVRGAQLQLEPQQELEQSSDACSDAGGGDDVQQPPPQDEDSVDESPPGDAVSGAKAELLRARQHSQKPRTLLGVIWRHVAGYDDAPQGQVLMT
jgi:hypothetical protein